MVVSENELGGVSLGEDCAVHSSDQITSPRSRFFGVNSFTTLLIRSHYQLPAQNPISHKKPAS